MLFTILGEAINTLRDFKGKISSKYKNGRLQVDGQRKSTHVTMQYSPILSQKLWQTIVRGRAITPVVNTDFSVDAFFWCLTVRLSSITVSHLDLYSHKREISIILVTVFGPRFEQPKAFLCQAFPNECIGISEEKILNMIVFLHFYIFYTIYGIPIIFFMCTIMYSISRHIGFKSPAPGWKGV